MFRLSSDLLKDNHAASRSFTHIRKESDIDNLNKLLQEPMGLRSVNPCEFVIVLLALGQADVNNMNKQVYL